MLEPAIPLDEASRLATLRGLSILDTPPEERFDRITRLAQRLLDVPIAVVSLVDANRQWFKSCQGLDASETPRSISFCGHAILDDQLFVIPDALLDPLFADNPLVAGAPHIRFYAGQPLKALNGSRLGTLCVIDRKPHHLTQAERDSLRDLALLVENELNSLDIKDATRELINSQNRLSAVLENILDGIITINDRGIVESFNQSAAKIFGYGAAEVIGNNVKMLMPEPYHSEHDGYLHHFATTGEKKVIGIGREVIGKRKDGSTFPMDLAVSEMKLGDVRMFTGIVRDITVRKRSEEDFANISRLSKAVVDGADHLIITTDINGVILSFNHAAEVNLGYRAEELVGKSSPAVFHVPEEVVRRAQELTASGLAVEPGFEVFVALARRQGKGDTHEWTYLRKDGSRFRVSLTVSALRDAKGEITAFLGIATDITERTRAAQELRDNEARLAGILNNVLDGIITINERGIVESFNQSAAKIFGYAAAEVIGNNVKMLMPEPFHSEHDGYLHHFATTGEKKIIGIGREVIGRRKDGSTFPMDLAVSEMKLGDVRMFTGIVRDITDRKRDIEEIRSLGERLQIAIETTGLGIWEWDVVRNILIWDAAMYKLYGVDPDRFGGAYESWQLGLHPEDAGNTGEAIQLALSGLKPYNIEFRIVWPTGEVRWIKATGMVQRDVSGAPLRMIGTNVDITERVQIERMKAEFISTVSHELRTPLTSIRGSLGLIAGGVAGELPAQVKALVDIAHKNSERLILLVNDILDMEKIEAGKMEFRFAPTGVISLLKQAVESNRPYAVQHNVTYELAGDMADVIVNVDANRLLQVLANLLSNAAKFSPQGGKVIVSATNDGQRVRVSVSDHGSGIPEQFRGQIFQKFAQADSSDTRMKGGTGLGLSITKAIVEHMGGSIGFDSQPNVLTTFFVEFPVWRDAMAAVAEATAPVIDKRKRVLICEDDIDIATLLRMMLEQLGLLADIAYDAKQARHLLAQHDYAAMTLDLGLPDQSGTSLIRELRAAKETANLPIIVVSANAEKGHKELQGQAFSVIDWINKPIDHDQLTSALEQAIAQTAGSRPRVLHVEDDPDIYRVVHAIVDKIADMENAPTLAAARKMLKENHYDLAILDVTLPDGSGMELLDDLNGASPPVPVMVFSAYEISMEAIHQVGAALVKSRTDNAQLLATIKRMIGVD